MTNDKICEEIRKISKQLMLLSNNIGSSNSIALDAVIDADFALFKFLKNQQSK